MGYLFIAAFLSLLIHRGGGEFSIPLFLELLLGSIVVVATGAALFIKVNLKNFPCKWLLYLITGALTTSLITYFISSLFGLPAGLSFIYFSAVIFVLILKKLISIKDLFDISKMDQLVLFCLLVFTLLWCWKISGSFPTLLSEGTLSTWVDVYYHGSQIAQLFDAKAAGQGDIFLAGTPPFAYHRASYLLPAIISQAAHLNGLIAATALLIPIGFLLLALTIYLLGEHLANKTVGILCVISLLVLPDNSWLGLHNGFLGFRYMLQVAPCAAYGLIGCLTSTLFLLQWLRDKSPVVGLLALLFGASVYLFRAHFFVLYFPTLISMMLLTLFHGKKYFYLASTLFLLFLSLYVANQSVVLPFLHLVHLERGDSFYTQFYTSIWSLNQPFLSISIGILLLLSGILGIWTFLYPLLLWAKVRRFGWEFSDFFPLVLLVVYIGIVLLAPAVYQTFDELQHRPSGLLFVVVGIFSLFYAIKILELQRLTTYAAPAVISCTLLGVCGTLLLPKIHLLRLFFRGHSLYSEYCLPLDSPIIQTAQYLQNHALPGEYFLTSEDDTNDWNVDSAVVVISISGMPSYLGQQTVQSLRAEPKRLSIINERDSLTRQSIIHATRLEEAFQRMREHHIAWYIALSSPKWDENGDACEFKCGSIALYHP